MRIIVCCKAVPKGVSNIRLEEGKIEYDSDSLGMNESDECALEEALALKKEAGEKITVVTMGGLRFQDILHAALAKGADKAVRIDADYTDPVGASRIIAEAIKKIEFDLILTGVESSDNLYAQTGISIAERLGIPYAFAVKKLTLKNGKVIATRELGQGVSDTLEIPLPALLCIESGTRPVSYPLFSKLMQARRMPIGSVTLEGSMEGSMEGSGLKLLEVFEPPSVSNCEMIEGNPAEIATELRKKFDSVLR